MYKWDAVAQASAMRCLDYDLTAPETIAGLKGISLDDYTRLLSLARRRQLRFRELLNDPSVFPGSHLDFACPQCKVPLKNTAWKVLTLELQLVFDRHSSGAAISREFNRWDAWFDTIRASHCRGSYLHNENETHSAIQKAIKSLPRQLKAE